MEEGRNKLFVPTDDKLRNEQYIDLSIWNCPSTFE